ncbi:MAG TPA: hypothetical protein PKX67_05900 [Anaerolineaceae bacterium]|nr:hypothetical protein [Anaerolineaceae bacterium]
MNKTLQLHRGTFSIEVTAPAGAGEYEIVATAEHQLAEWSVATSLANQLEDE